MNPNPTSNFPNTLERIALAMIVLGTIALVWYHRALADTALVKPIIDEYWITVSARWINDGLKPYTDFFQLHFPGSIYLYAAAERLFGGEMGAMRAVNSIVALLFGASLSVWFRLNGRGLAASLGVALLVSGPCIYMWPIVSPHLPGMLALVLGCLLLFSQFEGAKRIGWLFAGALLFFAGWTAQTTAVLAVATLIGALVAGTGEAPRKSWAPWVIAGAALPFVTWVALLLAGGHWNAFMQQALLFVVDDGYKQSGGINDVALVANFMDRLAREVGSGKLVYGGAAIASLLILWVGPLAALREWSSVRRALLFPALIAPWIFLSGRTDAHHAFYLCVPGLLILSSSRWDALDGRILKRVALAGVAVLAFAFFLATLPHLRLTLRGDLDLPDDRAQVQPAIDALRALGVARGEPVAVLPWAANLYHHGVVPGHRFVFVSAAGTGYQGEREWRLLREQMRASGTRWLAFYPAKSAAQFMVDGHLAEYLVVEGTTPRQVGRSGPIELWEMVPSPVGADNGSGDAEPRQDARD